MKRTPHDIGARLDRLLSRHRTPSPDRLQAAIDRVGRQIGSAEIQLPRQAEKSTGFSRAWLVVAATVTLATAVGIAMLWPERSTPLHSGLDRVLEGTVHQDDTLWTNGGNAQLALADGSRVEMRSQSEIALERDVDGIRIRLHRGGIIVNAAKQRTGHLYVQTKDMTVSVVGTVFLVNAEDRGSRVAVIEGEVRVQQGGTAKRLLPGEQVSTNPSMEARDVSDVIAWSLNSQALRALLQQSAVASPALPPPASADPRETFELAAIRPRPSPGGGGRGTGGSPCVGRGEIDPRRFAVTNTTLHNLIAWAHGKDCFGDADFLSGGPGWIRSDRFDLEARIPEGFPSYTMMHVRSGSAPKLQPMLQALLIERFKLVLRREMRERPVYVLTATDTPKLTPWKDGDGEATTGSVTGQSNASGQQFARLQGRKMSMARLAGVLGMPPAAGRIVLDRTGIVGEFNVDLQFVPGEAYIAVIGRETGAPPNVMTGPSLSTALEEQLGLRLEAIRAPLETLIVERAERPSAN